MGNTLEATMEYTKCCTLPRPNRFRKYGYYTELSERRLGVLLLSFKTGELRSSAGLVEIVGSRGVVMKSLARSLIKWTDIADP